MKSKAMMNYWVDVVIGVAFLLSAATGFVLLFAPSGGFQGGRNPHYNGSLLLLGRQTWNDIHTWSSVVMIAGVLGHLILHWNWMTCMTKRLFRSRRTKQYSAIRTEECPNPIVQI